jgi:hypothetical protein
VAGHARILEAGPVPFLHERIAVTDAAGLDFDPDLTGPGLGNFAFNDFKRPAGAGDLGSAHLGHNFFAGLHPQSEDANNLSWLCVEANGNVFLAPNCEL